MAKRCQMVLTRKSVAWSILVRHYAVLTFNLFDSVFDSSFISLPPSHWRVYKLYIMQNKNLKLIYQMIICTVHFTPDNVSELCMLMHYITFSSNSTNSFCRLLTKSSVENLAKVSASFFHKLCELKTFTFEPTMH